MPAEPNPPIVTVAMSDPVLDCISAPKGVKHIIYCHIAFNTVKDDLQFYIDEKKSKHYDMEINEFIRKLITNSLDTRGTKFTANSPLDVDVKQPSFVVFELSRMANWHFQPKTAGITKKKLYTGHYCGLVHAWCDDPPGSCTDPAKVRMQKKTAPNNDKCKWIYFWVPKPPEKKADRHGFNLHIRFNQDSGKLLPIIIDPDIRNTGGTGPDNKASSR